MGADAPNALDDNDGAEEILPPGFTPPNGFETPPNSPGVFDALIVVVVEPKIEDVGAATGFVDEVDAVGAPPNTAGAFPLIGGYPELAPLAPAGFFSGAGVPKIPGAVELIGGYPEDEEDEEEDEAGAAFFASALLPDDADPNGVGAAVLMGG